MNIETISWRDLTGNKYSKNLNPAMLSDAGYIAESRIRKIGDVQKTIFNVVYDKEYLVNYIIKSTCSPLFVLGKERVLELVDEAWDKRYPHSNVSHLNKQQAS